MLHETSSKRVPAWVVTAAPATPNDRFGQAPFKPESLPRTRTVLIVVVIVLIVVIVAVVVIIIAIIFVIIVFPASTGTPLFKGSHTRREKQSVGPANCSDLHTHPRRERRAGRVVKPCGRERKRALAVDHERAFRTRSVERAGYGRSECHFVGLNFASQKGAIRLNDALDFNVHPVGQE